MLDLDRRLVARATYAGMQELLRLAELAGESDGETMIEGFSRLPSEQRLVALTLCDALDHGLRALGVV